MSKTDKIKINCLECRSSFCRPITCDICHKQVTCYLQHVYNSFDNTNCCKECWNIRYPHLIIFSN